MSKLIEDVQQALWRINRALVKFDGLPGPDDDPEVKRLAQARRCAGMLYAEARSVAARRATELERDLTEGDLEECAEDEALQWYHAAQLIEGNTRLAVEERWDALNAEAATLRKAAESLRAVLKLFEEKEVLSAD